MPAGFAKMTKGIASWGWATVPQRHLKGRVLWYTQAKVIGGGSSINAQLYTRGNARDYDAWVTRSGLHRLGLSRRCCPTSSAPRTTSALPTCSMAMAGRSACRIPINPLPISEAFLAPAQEFGHPLQSRLQRRGPGRHRPLPADAVATPGGRRLPSPT